MLLEKPISLELWEADELITIAKRNNLKFTIGYSQRFNPKVAFAKKKIDDGTLGKVVSVLVSRHITRTLGTKIGKRVRLSPVVMESTHDLDFVFWLLEPAKPVRVYSQGAFGFMQPINGSHDIMFTTVTMDNGVVVMIGGGWNLPPSYPNYCSTWMEITGTDGALILDDTARDHWLNTISGGQQFPMSTMPGEQVGEVYAGGMGPETLHFLEACIRNTRVMVTPESARAVMEAYTAADLSADRNEPIDLPLTNETIAAVADFKAKLRTGDNVAAQVMRTQAKDIGLAIIGGGRVGLFRGEVANRHPAVKWIGLAEKNPNRAGEVAPKIEADFVTNSHVELLKRPEVTCAIIATDEHLHVDPIMVAAERGIPLLIEKPLATDLAESARVLKVIKDAKIDAVVGYTQRFRRKWLAGKEKVRTGALGDVTLVTSRAFMNRLVAIDNYKRTDDPKTISPMVISGTHALDMCMWYLEKKTPVECYARSIDKVLGPLYQGIDATAGMIMMSDGCVYHLNISWALPVTWPGAVYSLEVGIVGTEGVLTIDDTHRDMVLAVSKAQSEGYAPDETRLVDFLGSYPPGDMALGELRGPMAEETVSWLNRVALGLPTPAATVEEAHNRLMLTKALDLSAKRKQPVKLPLDPDEEKRAA